MQLLKITRIPIEYQIEIERPRLEMRQAQPAPARLQSSPARLNVDTQNIQVRLDTTAMRNSLGMKSVSVLIREAAQQGLNASMEATAEYARFGNQMAQIQDGVTISDIVAQKMLQIPDTWTVFLPSTGPEISWRLNDIDIQYQAGNLETDWEIERNVMDYIPGKFRMNILQYPKVRIEYVGEPSYFPPSANPHYEEEAV